MAKTDAAGAGHGAPQQDARVTPQRIMELTWGFAPPLMLEAAVRHGIFDLLDPGPKTLEEVAATGCSARGLRALMNGLVGLGLLSRQAERYALTPESAAFLVSTKPGFQGGLLRHIGRQIIPNWLELTEVVRTGQPAFPVDHEQKGAEFFRDFVEDLFNMNYPAARALGEGLAAELAPGAAGERVKVLDLAAGSGVWGIGVAERLPHVHVTAVDWAIVAPVAARVAQKHHLADRYHVIEGDLLSANFGNGYRAAILGHILHSEGEARSRKLLAKTYDALAPGGTIVIAEFVPNDDRTGPPQPLIFAVNMLVNSTQGDTFTFPELTTWLREAGFSNVRQLEAPSPSPLLLATKPGR